MLCLKLGGSVLLYMLPLLISMAIDDCCKDMRRYKKGDNTNSQKHLHNIDLNL